MAKAARKDIQTRVGQHEVARPASAGAKVRVYCKLPLGLVLCLDEMVTHREQVMGGGTRENMLARPTGVRVLIHGPATEIGKRSMSKIVHGFAITEGVLEEHWEHWLKSNKDSAYVKNGLIYATPGDGDKADAAKARELRDVTTGLEPLDTETDDKGNSLDPRTPRPSNRRNLTPLQEEDGERAEV